MSEKSQRFFRRLTDRELLHGTTAFPLQTENVGKANREVKRRAALEGLSVDEWLARPI